MSDADKVKAQFQQLQGCQQTEITTKDGKQIIAFHDKPMTDEERALVESFTAAELNQVMLLLGFVEHKLGRA